MKQIALGGKEGIGKFALVDDEDFERLNKFKWYITNKGYAIRYCRINGKRKKEMMHRIVNNTPEGLFTDHINGNKLDNRKINLRSCNHSQNAMNCGVRKSNKLGVKGVSIYLKKCKSQTHKYIKAKITVNGKQIHLGYFPTVELASLTYQEASKKYHGEFTKTI